MAIATQLQRFGQSLSNFGYLLANPNYSVVRKRGGNRDLYRLLNKNWLPRNKIKTVLDVGANEGQSLEVFLSLLPQANIALFEPNPISVEVLRRRIDALSQVKIFETACGREAAKLPLHVSSFSPASSLLKATNLQTEEFPEAEGEKPLSVSVERLDTLVYTNSVDLPGPFLLKVDVQGAELDVLQGATDLLPQVAVVTCEINTVDFYEGQAHIDALFVFLAQNHFRLVDISEPVRSRKSDEVLYADFAFLHNLGT